MRKKAFSAKEGKEEKEEACEFQEKTFLNPHKLLLKEVKRANGKSSPKEEKEKRHQHENDELNFKKGKFSKINSSQSLKPPTLNGEKQQPSWHLLAWQ